MINTEEEEKNSVRYIIVREYLCEGNFCLTSQKILKTMFKRLDKMTIKELREWRGKI